ncbi:MAG TPA: biosynthetic arginine decarboxylase [Gammaproteobacteria bacterium]|nr:biosynthetic arginine decarboxylase [Gammaproteobacteria bacterium]
MPQWTIEKARKLYNIKRWGAPYFDINQQGNVTVSPDGHSNRRVDLLQVIEDIRTKGLGLPVLLRITDILKDRVYTIHQAFSQAKARFSYAGAFFPVYPIKVNQQRTVVEHILKQTTPEVGLETGSKSELMIALSHAKQGQNLIICNGYKDRDYIRLALIAQKLDHKLFIVIEKVSELDLILRESETLNITPQLGIRIKLTSVGKGNWQNSGGEKSKFGLSANQVLHLVQSLKKHDKDNCLQLIHCHIGSQLADIRDIQTGLHEIARYYAELRLLGLDIQYIDVGGGLGIDYEGSQTSNYCSMNYNIQEYANDIVQTFKQSCINHHLPHPNIITESGRAMTAHHAILISDIIDTESVPNENALKATSNEPSSISNLRQILQTLSDKTVQEAYHDAAHWLAEIQTMYTHGILNLQQRANAEALYFAICKKAQTHLSENHRAHREIMAQLNEKLADKYFCNFSIFQSLPDIWGIGQVFPIMPLHRLNEKPSQHVTLQDLTCDSDGSIANYVEKERIKTTLAAHKLKINEPYLMGFFLVGAYQEILGDMHNLFGDTHSIDIAFSDDGSYQLVEAEPGDSVEEILSIIHYSSAQLLQNYQQKIDQTSLPQHEKDMIFATLKNSLKAYSYYVNE